MEEVINVIKTCIFKPIWFLSTVYITFDFAKEEAENRQKKKNMILEEKGIIKIKFNLLYTKP